MSQSHATPERDDKRRPSVFETRLSDLGMRAGFTFWTEGNLSGSIAADLYAAANLLHIDITVRSVEGGFQIRRVA